MSEHAGHPATALRPALVLGALGVVFGDIGTSPIYTLQTVFNPDDPHPVPLSRTSLLGVVSLVFWSVMLIVTVTYVLLAMRVDNDGEGGIMALITLLRRTAGSAGPKTVGVLAALGIFGAALFLGDSMITPAISVLSAVEGLKVIRPSFGDWVVPLTIVVLIALFLVQRRGTSAVGRVFGPVMLLWFSAIGAAGIWGITRDPQILKALSPTYAIEFVGGHFHIAFFAFAAVVLAVTGAEALYADMGHFGRRPITLAWTLLVLPACALSYLGQGALILKDGRNIGAPFFLLVPHWGRVPIVLLATAATVIAAQSVITGAYSLTAQAAQLGYLPRLRVRHTSKSTYGQIYVPWINWLLMVAVLGLVLGFRSSAALAYAYGMAVTLTILITTVLFINVARRRWPDRWRLLIPVVAVLVLLQVLLFAANLTKFVDGAWLPLLIGLLALTIMTTWQRGRVLVTLRRAQIEGPLREFVDELHTDADLRTVPGTAIFLNRGAITAPLALRANVQHNRVRHQTVVIASVEVVPVPRMLDSERISVDALGDPDDGIVYASIRFGYTESPDVPSALAELTPEQTEGELDLENATYFLSKMALRPGDERSMPRWRKRLFIATSHITADAAEHFCLPGDRTVLLGSHVDV